MSRDAASAADGAASADGDASENVAGHMVVALCQHTTGTTGVQEHATPRPPPKKEIEQHESVGDSVRIDRFLPVGERRGTSFSDSHAWPSYIDGDFCLPRMHLPCNCHSWGNPESRKIKQDVCL